MNELAKTDVKKVLVIGKYEFEITNDEFKKIDEFIKKGKTGLIKLKSEEYVNLSFVQAIKNKNKVIW